MPLTGDFVALRKLERQLQDLSKPGSASQKLIANGVAKSLKELVKQQFLSGVGPYGEWQRTKRGKPALLSRKLASGFKATVIPGGLVIRLSPPESTVTRWLFTHHEGFTFPARAVKGGQTRFFNRSGRLIRHERAMRWVDRDKDGKFQAVFKRGVFRRVTKAHVIGSRQLPERPLWPSHGMSESWADAINKGARDGMDAWYRKATP